MVSILTVPEQKSSGAVTVALTPDDTREWLGKLVMAESEETLARIYHELHDLNRVPVKPEVRLRLLELYRAPVKFIVENIEAKLIDRNIPISKSQAMLGELCKRVMIEMAYGYKRVVLDLARSIRSFKPSKDLRITIHRSIYYLAQSVLHSALYYSIQPPGTWMEIHSLYNYARKFNLLQKPIRDALNQAKPKNSIAHVYQQAILFGVSSVYKQSVPVTGKLYRYLDRWASLVEVKDFDRAPTTRCQFVIEPEQDRPGHPFEKETAPKRTKSLLLLDARAITNVAHSQWNELASGSKPKSTGLGEEFFDGNGFEMLEQAIRAWGLAPRRQQPRNTISGPFQLVIGINGCVFCMNGEQAFATAAAASSREVPDTTESNSRPTQPGVDEDPVRQNWTGVNESTHGICLSVDLGRPSSVLIRIGEVVAYRTNRGNARWSAGLVRWVCINDTELRTGIQQLGVDCRPAAINPIDVSDSSGADFKGGIFVPGGSGAKRFPSLVTPAGTYGSGRKLMVDDGKVTKTAQISKLLERSPHYDWFEFHLIDI
jgi:hypothetical protein